MGGAKEEDRRGVTGSSEGIKFSRTLGQWLETVESVEETTDKLLEPNVGRTLKLSHEIVKNLQKD